MRLKFAVLFGVAMVVGGYATTASAQEYRGPTRVNFDERLIKGQTTKSGSVYIFDRQETKLKSLVTRKRLFREKTIRTVF
jgi:hypothetical protein